MTNVGLVHEADAKAGENQILLPESGAGHKMENQEKTPRAAISNILKEKEQEWASVAAKKGPLKLLDLPLDVLKEIMKDVCFYSQSASYY